MAILSGNRKIARSVYPMATSFYSIANSSTKTTTRTPDIWASIRVAQRSFLEPVLPIPVSVSVLLNLIRITPYQSKATRMPFMSASEVTG